MRAVRIVPLLLLCAAVAQADAPEWLRAAAQAPAGAYPLETKAVMLLDEQITTVSDNGEIRTLYRRAYRILRPDGRRYGQLGVSFDNDTKLLLLKGWCIPAQGKDYEVKERDATEISLGDGDLYSDDRAKILKVPAAEPGNVVGFEWEQKRRPTVLQDVWFFQDPLPVRRARYSLRLPRGWEYRIHWFNHAKIEPRTLADNTWSWELENVPAVEDEPSMPPWRAVAGWLAVTYFPASDALRQKAHASWNEIAVFYAQLAAGRRDLSPAMREKAAELTSGRATALEKIRVLATFAQRDIRYVAIEIGIGGYQPHLASEIFANRYGDCKDKVTLLSSLLREAGIESHYVLVNATRGVTQPEFPSMLNFNHVIIGIKLPPATDTSALFAAQNVPTHGPMLFFDPTDTGTPFGYLPSSLQANHGLLVTEQGGELIALPLLAPTTNRLLRVGKLTLASDGTLSGDVQEIRWGAHAVDRRALLLAAQGHERVKVMENILSNWFSTGFTLRSAEAENLNDFDKGLVLRYRFDAPRYAQRAGNLLLVRPRVLGQKTSDIMERKDRRYPVEFETASLETDMYEITLPPGLRPDELPPPVKVDAGFAEYESKVEMAGNVLKYTRTYTVKDVRVAMEKQAELKKFYRIISADERNTAVFAPH